MPDGSDSGLMIDIHFSGFCVAFKAAVVPLLRLNRVEGGDVTEARRKAELAEFKAKEAEAMLKKQGADQ